MPAIVVAIVAVVTVPAALLLLVVVLQLLSKFLDSSTRDTANSRSEDHLQTENNHVLPATAFSILHSPFHG